MNKKNRAKNIQKLSGIKYLEYLRNKTYCCVCLKTTPVEPHHLKAVGMGGNRKKEIIEHYTAIPVCRNCHSEYHDKGEKYQADKYVMNHWKENAKYLREFIYAIFKHETNNIR